MQDIEWLNWHYYFAIFASVKLLWNVMAIYRQKSITRHSVELLRWLSEELFIMTIQYIHVEYGYM